MLPRTHHLTLVVALLAILSTNARPQGLSDYFNVESSQVHPIEIAWIDDTGYLLVCNTPDSSVEIWETSENEIAADRFVTRVRTGLEPVTVRWFPELDRMYTANFLGDSVTVVRLEKIDDELVATVERTNYVGDEPMDIAFGTLQTPRPGVPDVGMSGASPAPTGSGGGGGGGPIDDIDPEPDEGPSSPPGPFQVDPIDPLPPGPGGPTLGSRSIPKGVLYITLNTANAVTLRNPLTLKPTLPGLSDVVHLTDTTADPDRNIKEPHAVAYHDGELYVLGFKGGNDHFSDEFDFDLFIGTSTGKFRRAIDGLGSTNWNMAFADDGDLFVVGGEAQNDIDQEPNVKEAPTGFVKSTLYWIEDPTADVPVVRRRDLNAVADDAALSILDPVPPEDALAHATDVVVFEQDGQPLKLFLTAFGSDRVGVLQPQAGVDPVLWPTNRIDVPTSGDTDLVAGPRGLVVKEASPLDFDDPGARIYVLNRLDNSVSILDPITETWLETFPLRADPRPADIRNGARFLYSAKLTSENGFNSCSSCHTDGRLDGLSWNLGDLSAPRDPFPLNLANGIPHDAGGDGDCTPANDLQVLLFQEYVVNGFPPKGHILTQSLQGLLNFEFDQTDAVFVTNAVYHWRGDRGSLAAFNPAFVNLLGGTDVSGDPETPPAGLTDEEMFEFISYINSIHYPPNPLQPIERVYSGSFGPAEDADDATVGTGAQLGSKLYHISPINGCFGLSCVGCHSLPEGSDNRLTEMLGGLPQPLETAALKGGIQKWKRLDLGASAVSDVRTGEFGFNHLGGRASMVGFNQAFAGDFGGLGPNGEFPPDLIALNEFCLELDWGVAPMVGRSWTVSRDNVDGARTTQWLERFEGQVEAANAGLVAQAFLDGSVDRGFWYDTTGVAPTYREEPSGTTLTRSQLLNLLTLDDERIVLQSVPLGDERRLANVGVLVLAATPAPTNIELLGMAPNTANGNLPLMRKNWQAVPLDPGFGLEWVNPCAPTPRGLHGIRLFQYGLIQDAASENGFGLGTELRHEAPRRLVVAGFGIQHGATLNLHVPDGPTPPNTAAALGDNTTNELVFPIYPTNRTTNDGRPIWETAIEVDPLVQYALALGGARSPNVVAAAFDTFDVFPEPPPLGTFDPLNWNWHYVEIDNNDGGPRGDGGFQRLTLQ